MTEGYEEKSSCARCLRSSVIASLIGFILVLIGGGAYGGATIFARRYLVDLLEATNLLSCLDYVVYGLVGAICLFTLLAYILCAFSSGCNAKHCFDSHFRSACGRCCNMTLLLLLVCAVLLWTAIASLVSYPVISIAVVSHRPRAPDPTALINTQLDVSQLERQVLPTRPAVPSIPSSSWPNTNTNNNNNENFVSPSLPSESPWSPNKVKRVKRSGASSAQTGDEEFGPPESWSDKLKASQPDMSLADSLPSVDGHELDKSIESALPDSSEVMLPASPEVMQDTANEAKKIFGDVTGEALKVGGQVLACSPYMVDLSYYGLYHQNGLPILISRTKLDEGVKPIFICVCISLAGIFLLLLGYLQIIICTAMNYARLQETRYYDTSDAGEEGVALQQ